MKIRNGFVSNSSSSSFIAIGISEYQGYKKPTLPEFKIILDKSNFFKKEMSDFDDDWADNISESVKEVDHGEFTVGNLSFYSDEEGISFIGMNVIKLLEEGLTLSEMKIRCLKEFENLGVKLKEENLELRLSTSGS